jgi:LL-diaminopimelate aminotransferase
MYKLNENFQKLPGSYLFAGIANKVEAFQKANPDRKIIRLGIGDVTQPLPPTIIRAIQDATEEMAHADTFRGYAPGLGYDFLRTAIAENDYAARGCSITPDEIIVSDGAKCDSGNIQELFAEDNKIAVCDPVYPVYVDSNVMAGRTGSYDAATETWSDVIYPCRARKRTDSSRICRRRDRISFTSASRTIRPALPSRRTSCRNGSTMPMKTAA